MNMRARELVGKYRESARIEGGRYVVSSFAMRAVFEMQTTDAWFVPHKHGTGEIKVSVHELKKEDHAIGEDLWLVMIEETEYRGKIDIFVRFALTPCEVEIAVFLVETSLSNKEIAARIGKSPDTVRTQTNTIYRKCEVHSRIELRLKLEERGTF